jgi:adenomatosis polyposis coli protein
VAALMKLSFEEEHRNAICELGGLHAVAELVEIDNKVNADCNDSYSIGLRKYADMTLTNLTFGNTKNKTILCTMEKTVKALIAQLKTADEEELVQVSASVLRNLSWRADDISRDSLRKVGAVTSLTEAAQNAHGEPALRTLLSGLWNLSAHCPENKTELCNVPGGLRFFVKSLNYCSPSGNISVIESSGGILRNLSSHIAVRPEYRQILRDNGCFHTLLSHLRSPIQDLSFQNGCQRKRC